MTWPALPGPHSPSRHARLTKNHHLPPNSRPISKPSDSSLPPPIFPPPSSTLAATQSLQHKNTPISLLRSKPRKSPVRPLFSPLFSSLSLSLNLILKRKPCFHIVYLHISGGGIWMDTRRFSLFPSLNGERTYLLPRAESMYYTTALSWKSLGEYSNW